MITGNTVTGCVSCHYTDGLDRALSMRVSIKQRTWLRHF